ncbi:hypothetical protein K502DRAFT_284233, partial [Neoconidiobolus thromboides FSU 785]
RVRKSRHQESMLFDFYKENHYPTKKERIWLSNALNLSERKIQIWFQNQRRKEK